MNLKLGQLVSGQMNGRHSISTLIEFMRIIVLSVIGSITDMNCSIEWMVCSSHLNIKIVVSNFMYAEPSVTQFSHHMEYTNQWSLRTVEMH